MEQNNSLKRSWRDNNDIKDSQASFSFLFVLYGENSKCDPGCKFINTDCLQTENKTLVCVNITMHLFPPFSPEPLYCFYRSG